MKTKLLKRLRREAWRYGAFLLSVNAYTPHEITELYMPAYIHLRVAELKQKRK